MILTVIGDCNVDVVCELPAGMEFSALSAEPLLYRDIDVICGGSLCNLSVAAREHFSQVHAIGCVGDDAFGVIVRDYLHESGVSAHIATNAHRPTGVAVALRESLSHAERPASRRTMLVRRDSAGKTLESSHIETLSSIISSSDHLFVDGYLLHASDAREGCLRAMKIARSASRMITVDLVPHRAWKSLPLTEVDALLGDATAVISEVGTLFQIFGVPFERDMMFHEEDARRAASVFLDALPDKGLLVRYGIDSCSHTLVHSPGGSTHVEQTGYDPAGPVVGFGDSLTGRQLRDLGRSVGD